MKIFCVSNDLWVMICQDTDSKNYTLSEAINYEFRLATPQIAAPNRGVLLNHFFGLILKNWTIV